jgi:hypothetical protein
VSDISSVGFMARRSSAGGGGVNVDNLIRSQRRLDLLQTYATDFVTSSPSAAMAMAESTAPDDEILRGATESIGFANIVRIQADLGSESPEVQRTVWANMPAEVQRGLGQLGYQPPKSAGEGGGRLWGSIPVLGDVTKRVLDWGSVPLVGGALEEVQHGGGETAEALRQATGFGLRMLDKPSSQIRHAYRATVYAREEGQTDPGGWTMFTGGWSPSEIGRAWGATGDENDSYIRPEFANRARRAVQNNDQSYQLAYYTAMHKSIEEILKGFGFEPTSVEAAKLIAQYNMLQGDAGFKSAVNAISSGQVSFGRSIVQEAFGVRDSDHGLGRYVSGLLDAGVVIGSDPLLIAGKVSEGARFGRTAFQLESAAGRATAIRHSDLALMALRAREGADVGQFASNLDRVTSADMRLGRNILGWSDRVSTGFATGEFSQLMRDMPNVSTAMQHMSDYHVRQVAQGLRGLDTPLGVVEYLQNRDGWLALMGSRVGGASPKAWGLRMPTLRPMDRAIMATKDAWTRTIDWSRFVGQTPDRVYGPMIGDVVRSAGHPADFARQAGRWFSSKTIGNAGRTMAMLTAHTPYRGSIVLDSVDAVPEFGRLVNTGLFAGMSRQSMDDFVNAFARGDIATRAKIQEDFLSELFHRSNIHEDAPFARRFLEAARRAQGLADDQGPMRLLDIHDGAVVAIPDVRGFLSESYRINRTRMVFHNPTTAWTEAMLAKWWKPSVLIRLGFIARASGEELLHTILKFGPRSYLGTKGTEWMTRAEKANEVRAALDAAETAGHADEINRLRHSLADLEGSMFVAPIRSLMAGSDRMFSQLFASTVEGARPWRANLATKVERFDPHGSWRTVSGIERFADEMSLWASGVMGRIAKSAPGSLTKERIGELMAEHWNPAAAAAAREMLHNETVARVFTESIAGSTMMPWEFRPIIDADGVPIEKVTFAEFRQGQPVLQDITLRNLPGEHQLDRVLDDPTFTRSLYTRHDYTRRDRVARAVVDNVLPRYVGTWGGDVTGRLGFEAPDALRRQLNLAWSHNLTAEARANLEALPEGAERARGGFESGGDAVKFLRRYVDGDIDPDLPKGWIASRLNDVFTDAGVDVSGGRLLGFLDDPEAPMAAKRWLLYDFVDPDRLLSDGEGLRKAMRHAARGRAARPDMQPALRQNRLYARGEPLAVPVQKGISKVYVPLMPATYAGEELTDDFIEAATRRIIQIGGYGPDQADQIARNAAAASVSPGIDEASRSIGFVPLSAWGASDPRLTDALLAAAEDVTGLKGQFGILEVPDEVIERSTDRVLAQGVARAEGASDFSVDGWRLRHTKPTAHERRYVTLDIGDEPWDSGALDAATRAFEAPVPDTTRLYSADRVNWTPEAPEGPFWFADVPGTIETPAQTLAGFRIDDLRRQAQILGIRRYSRMHKSELVDALAARPEMRSVLGGGTQITDELIDAAGAHRLPGVPGSYAIEGREVADGLPEITALERAADRSVDEVIETLTTLNKPDVADDVLHEIVEPLKRGDRYIPDPETGVETLEKGYRWPHLLKDTSPERLPTETYGPQMVAGRDLRWDGFVREWFDGPVDKAISAIIRKPMFLNTFGRELGNVEPMADLLVDPAARAAAEAWAGGLGIPADELDDIVRASIDLHSPKARLVPDDDIVEAIAAHHPSGAADAIREAGLEDIKRYAVQRHHALNLARDNALNRSVQLTVPFIDDHRIRSAFQNYIGNFVPFLFAEEQFLKRWVRSAVESPEMIRRAQLAMHGLRSMGTVRKDDQGRSIFVYPLVGDIAEILSKPIDWITGGHTSLPYSIQMTGDVGYTLPGFGDQMGVPSVGPLVGMGTEALSRLFPELSEVEDVVVGRGANRPLWQYIIPSGAAKLWEAGWGDIDQGQLASATIQAIQTMAINGQLPPETATPEERQAFIDRARSQARFILAMRGMFGMTAPAAPIVHFEHDELTDEFRALLQADIPFEDAIRLFLANHPEAAPGDVLAATVASTESEFSGMDMPTDKAYDWVSNHEDLVQAYPAAAAWLMPRADSEDRFSQRAYNQQISMGLRLRKHPKDFIDDLYFRTASQDYFDARTLTEEKLGGLSGASRQQASDEWRVWKDAYFSQHPLFAVMLQDPERQQKRHQAVDQLVALSARDDEIVAPELAEMMRRFSEFQLQISALRGDRRHAVSARRASIVGETAAWMRWQIARHPSLAGVYLRLLEPELRDADEDAVTAVVDDEVARA